jgi:hypothetical protein
MMADPEDASVQRAHAADMTPAPAPDEGVEGDASEVAGRAPSSKEQLARSIVRSKVQPPPVRDSTLERPRLLEWLTDRMSDRLVVISAEAGYGKTTLLADFARRAPIHCLWVQLDATDGDWITFINYLIAAIREAQPEFGAETASLLGQMATANVTMDAVLDSLISELPALTPGPALLILDDFHLVDDSKDVHAIVARILEFAPSNLSVLVASRTPPSIRAARLTAQGRASRLGSDDLRFSSEETADLFASAYELPLEADLLAEIDARAEGWAASLQLVYSSIRERQPSDARVFIRSLSGASGPLYDYLAEEVLTGLSDRLRRVLTRASLLEWIVPAYVLAILSTEPSAPSQDELQELLDEADRRGLLGRTAVGAPVKRFHPLLRTFLEHELNATTSTKARQRMHLAVAEAAEADDWITAADHYISAERQDEAMRVIEESATAALGGGDFDAVVRLIARVPDITPPLAVQALRSRALLASDGERAALDLLGSLEMSGATNYERSIVALAQAAAFYQAGLLTECQKALIEAVRPSNGLPDAVAEIAEIWMAFIDTSPSRSSRDVIRSLKDLGDRQSRAGHYFHAAISFHNAAVYSLLIGDYAATLEFGDQAIAAFLSMNGRRDEYASTLMTVAATLFETGSRKRAIALANSIASIRGAQADAHADAAYLQALTGSVSAAGISLARAHQALSRAQGDPGAPFSVANAEAYIALVAGRPDDAVMALSSTPELGVADADVGLRREVTLCLAHLTLEDGIAADHLAAAIDLERRAGAARYRSRLAILDRVIAYDWRAVGQLIDEQGQEGDAVAIDLADVLLQVASLDDIPKTIGRSIAEYPDRWIPLARRQLTRGQHPVARAAARVLAEFGTADDLPRVVAYERTYLKGDRSRPMSRQLIIRASPRLAVHDLGRIRYELSGRTTLAAHTRRKASALLAYLITCPNQTATKDQVIEGLWPELDGASGANSFNQTLYFLRRDIDPWYLPPTSPEYVVNESDLVWLDKELVHLKSVDFYDAARLLPVDDAGDGVLDVCNQYIGRFAPEFEYEQWSMGWRDGIHALYLSLVHRAVAALAMQVRLHDALSVFWRHLE